MSEQIELDGMNLCITEDTFEKFQASSLCEVKQCLVLSQPAQSERSEDNLVTCSDDVSGNEVNTDCHDDPDHKAGTSETLKNSTGTPLPSGSSNDAANKFIHGKKRGRKKKTTIKNSEQLNVSNSDSVTISDFTDGRSESIEDIQNFIQNTNPTPTSNRRGRPPKSNNSSFEDLSLSKRRLSKESVTETTKDSSVIEENQVPRRRGRPRKSHESLSINTVTSSHNDESPLVDSSQHQNFKNNTSSPGQIQKNIDQQSNILPEENLYVTDIIDKTDDTKPSDSLPNVSKGLTQTKIIGKRGRPKKKDNTNKNHLIRKNKNNQFQMSPHNVFLEENQSEENDDDMSLSIISKIVHNKTNAEKSIKTEENVNNKELTNNKTSQKKETLNTIEVSENELQSYAEETPLEVEKTKTDNDAKGSPIGLKNSVQESLNLLKGSSDPNKIVEKTYDTNDAEAIKLELENESSKITEENKEQLTTPQKRNSKVPIMSDFEYNLDNIDNGNIQNKKRSTSINDPCSLLVEDVSKRPTRKKARQIIQYHDESDEDPFANIELSDDEPIMRRKGRRYNSDDEYIPVAKSDSIKTMSSDSESNNEDNNDKKQRKRKYFKKSDSQSPRKRGRRSNIEKAIAIEKSSDIRHELTNDDDDCIQLSDIKSKNDTSSDFNCRTEIETLLAKKIQGTNLKIKKVSSSENTDTITPLKIPTIDPSEPKKVTDMDTQTNKIVASNVDTQTEALYDIPMKNNVTLTTEQSEKACEFLNSIVNTTAELGKLLTQKSEDFMKKKINTEHVVDTVKMDYCVKKSFLLFKLAKHNLTQMEEDLATQYEEFLSNHDLLKHREQPKIIQPNVKDSDSDCEIIEESIEVKQLEKPAPKFNPKTVFLNKELSIKIAKKPSEDKNLSIKGKHTVWINDSVMVKKVKPTQSFLAQDSRNKKPPDQKFITTKMVSDFFEDYYRKKTLTTCSPYTSPIWLHLNHKSYVCHYFVVNTDFTTHDNGNQTEDYHLNTGQDNSSTANSNQNLNSVKNNFHVCETHGPETLLTLCTKVLQKHLQVPKSQINGYRTKSIHALTNKKNGAKLKSLLELCIQVFCHEMKVYKAERDCKRDLHHTVLTLKTLCYLKILKLLLNPTPTNVILTESRSDSESTLAAKDNNYSANNRHIKSLSTHWRDCIHRSIKDPHENVTYSLVKKNVREIKSLFCLCVQYFRNRMNNSDSYNPMIKCHKMGVKSLTTLCVESINGKKKEKMLENIVNTEPKRQIETIKSLFSLCVESLQNGNTYSDKCIEKNKTENCRKAVKTLFSLCVESFQHRNTFSNKCIVKPNSESPCFECAKQGNAYTDHCDVNTAIKKYRKTVKSLVFICIDSINFGNKNISNATINRHQRSVMSLFSICLEYIQKTQNTYESSSIDAKISSLRFRPKSLKDISLKNIRNLLDNNSSQVIVSNNESATDETLFINSELADAFTINSVNTLSEEAFHNLQNTVEDHYYEDYDDGHTYSNNDEFESTIESTQDHNSIDDKNWISQVRMKELQLYANTNCSTETDVTDTNGLGIIIKSEPVDDLSENTIDTVSVKIEPINEFDEMTMIPEIVTTKSETVLSENTIEDQQDTSNEIYSQSSLRIRQQHEPDYVGEHDIHDGLLIPHTYANVFSAKKSLMANTSNEDNLSQNILKKNQGKRKIKTKKTITKLPNKEIPLPSNANLTSNSSEVDGLTRRMKNRIRLEEKDVRESFKLDNEDVPLSIRKNKDIKKYCNKKKLSPNPDKNAIQCSEVDSTEQLNSTLEETDSPVSNTGNLNNIADESNIESCSDSTSNSSDSLKKISEKKSDSLTNLSDPKERIECEPTISDYINQDLESVDGLNEKTTFDEEKEGDKRLKEDSKKVKFRERFGWSCYAVDTKDPKLHQETAVLLDRLPESFVKTYLQYQQIGGKDEVDMEIDRLTNVNSLNRTSKKLIGKLPKKLTSNEAIKKKLPKSGSVFEDYNILEQLSSSHELSPSDDEEIIPENDPPPVHPMKHAENYIAKDSLMNDESETEEISTDCVKEEPVNNESKTKRPGPKRKTKRDDEKISDNELILTADKMMNEELALLHTPPTMSDALVEITKKDDGIKTRKKTPRKVKHEIKFEEDSSSEEEKQWVTKKEKLLKKMKRQKQASVCEAKRAKMVSEFIERRGGTESRIVRGKHRGSIKKLLEREKQLNVLSRELYGESSSSATHPRKSYFCSNFNGRRNIRKVIDKKSLKHCTVKANMEEIDRKRRLNERQNKLREHLGCEESVNVLVINDEVCLEYDFEEDRPIVTVHKFFTKVMKAHQYEGVKFMWDACFESVSRMRGGPGGAAQGGAGCILAHCMGLGKTLQVLALLHTVLTHPGVGMKRVLVCCPLSTALNWVDEIHKWIGPVTDEIKVFELSKLKKTYERAYQLEDWYTGGGIFIIGYELFRSLTTLDPALDDVRPTIVRKIRTALLDPGPDVVVCDEGHLLKNDCSVLAVAMSRVATKRRIVLTGTPMQNNLREYYCMVNFIKPNLLGSYAEYSNRFANPIMNGQHRDSSEEDIKLMKTRTHILHKVLEGCLQRHEASVLYPYLPKKREYTVFIPLTKCQWDLYKHYMYTYCKPNKQSILKDFHILQKIWTHPQVLHNFNTQLCRYKKPKDEKLEDELAREDLAADDIKRGDTEAWWLQYLDHGDMLHSLHSSNKFVAVFRILHECIQLGDKVLIFSTSLYCLDTLEYFLKKINDWSLGQEYYRLDGSVPAEVRHKWCREFNAEVNDKTKLFLISTRAGCLGLNMTAANRVIILDTSWNPAHDIQSIFRVYRFGQKKDCFIYRLVAMGTMEQKIYERSVTKQAVACRVIDEQQIDRHYNSADLAELYSVDEAGGGVAGGVAAGVRDVALLRVARDGPVHAVHEHDSLLQASEPALPEHERAAAWHQFQLERAAEQDDNEPTVKKTKLTTKVVKVKSNNETEPTPQEPGPSKVKKEDTSTNTTAEIEIASPTPENPYQNEIIEKVVNLLFKHNYPNLNTVREMTNVVNIVQHIISRVPVNEENKDHVVKVITDNLLQHLEKRSKAAETACANIIECDKTTEITQEESQKSALPQKKSERLKEKQILIKKRKELNETNNSAECNKNEQRTHQGREKITLEPDLHKNANKEKKINVKDEHDIPTGTKNFKTPVNKVRKIRKVFSKDSELHKVLEQNTSFLSELLYANEPRDNEPCVAGDIPSINLDSNAKETKQISAVTISNNEVPTVSRDLNTSINKQKKTDKAVPKVSLELKFSRNKNKRTNTKSSEKEDAIVIDDVPVEVHKTNFVPDSNNAPTTEIVKEKISRKSTKSSSGPSKKRERTNKKKESNIEKPAATETSILLSDDDDVSIVQTNSSGSVTAEGSRVEPRTYITKPDEANDEPVPLHPSLLSNKHFIALVAHTYSDGNRTLDADAATLAAQYSTLKAKKELEQTGRSIISGPLHDIAVKFVGLEILRKLHKASNNKPSTKTIAEVEAALRLEESACDLPKISPLLWQKNTVAETVASVAAVEPTPPKTMNVTSGEKLTVAHSPQSSSNVVPVELFKGPSIPGSRRTRQNREECILPDDDVQMTHNNKPQRGPITTTTTTPTLTHTNKGKPIVSPKFNVKAAPTTSVNATNTAVSKSSTTVNTLTNPPPIAKNTIVTGRNELTICLDSDDEQTAETTAAHSPVPVALTSVNIQPMPVTKVTSSPSSSTSHAKKRITVLKSIPPAEVSGQAPAKPLILAIRNRQLANAAESKQGTSPTKSVADGSNKITLLYTADKNKRAIERRLSSKPEEASLASEANATTKPNVKSKEESTTSYGCKRRIVAVTDNVTCTNEKNKTKLKVDKKANAKSNSLSLKFMPMIDLTSISSPSSKKIKLDESNHVDLCTLFQKADVMKEAKALKGKASSKKSFDLPQTSSSEKKRSSTFDNKAPKKKKPHSMTLQDFDIDDLDDIIELE